MECYKYIKDGCYPRALARLAESIQKLRETKDPIIVLYARTYMSTVCISLCPTSLIIFNMVGDTLSDLEAEEYEIESKVSSEGSEDTLEAE